jgi:hypothetical protein
LGDGRDNKIKIDDYPQIRLVLIARQFYGLTVSLSSSGAKTEKNELPTRQFDISTVNTLDKCKWIS